MFQYNGEGFFSGAGEGLKLLYLGAVGISALLITNAALQALLLAVTVSMLVIAGFREFKKVFLVLAPMLIVTDLAFWFFLPNPELDLGARLLVSNIRMLNIFLSAAFFAFTTDIFALMKTLERARVPEVITLPTYVLFRFLPEIERDLAEIMAVQKLRGYSPKQPISYFKAVFVPVLYTLFERADGVGLAYYLRRKRGK